MADNEITVKLNADASGIIHGTNEAKSAVQDFASDAEDSLAKVSDGFEDIGEKSTDAASSMKGLKVAGVDLAKLKSAMAGGAGAASILTEGIKALGTIAKTVYGWIKAKAEEAAEAMRRTAAAQKEANDAANAARKANLETMKSIASLQGQESLSNAQKAKMYNLVNQLSKAQGGLNLKIDEGTGKVKNFDAAYAKALQKDKEMRQRELESEIANQQSLIDRANNTIETAGVNLWGVNVGGRADIKEAQKEMEAATNEKIKLMKELAALKKTDPAGDYLREAEAKKKDMLEAQAKEWNDVYKGLAENLEDMGADELNRQLLEIQRKYDETVNRLGGLAKIPKELKAKLDEWRQAETARLKAESAEKARLEAQQSAEALASSRASLDETLAMSEGREFEAQRMRLKKQYDKLKKELGGELIAKDDLSKLNAWYSLELDKILSAEREKRRAAASQETQDAEKALREQFSKREALLKSALDKEVKAHEDALRRIEKERSKYKFTLPDFDPLQDTSAARRDRRSASSLDASISAKLARQEAGERVRYTRAERKRIEEAQALERRAAAERQAIIDAQKNAALKLSESAEKLEKAVEKLYANAEAEENGKKKEDNPRRQGRVAEERGAAGGKARPAQTPRLKPVPHPDAMQPVVYRLDRIIGALQLMAAKTYRVV